MMDAKKTHSISFALLFILCGVMQNSFATHISEPVLINPKTQYKIGDMVILHGRVDYNAQPAPDVLLNFKLICPDGTGRNRLVGCARSEGASRISLRT